MLPRIWNCISNRDRCFSISIFRSGLCSAPSAWSAMRLIFRPGRAFGQHTDEPAQRRLSRRRQDEPGDLPHRRTKQGGVCTIGSCVTKPGIVTSVVEDCRITLDQRHLDAMALARMLKEAQEASERFAERG